MSSGEPSRKRLKLSSNDNAKKGKAKTSSTVDKSKQDGLAGPTVSLRRFKRIPIFIVEYHNDILEFIYRCLGSRFMPLLNNTLVHFDSHADMVISREIPASYSYNKKILFEEISIENWMMPACYVGHFNRVIWLKHSWCHQMPEGKYNFKIGHKDDIISVDSTLEYFVAEGNYVPTAELQQARDFELQVHNTDSEIPPHPVELLSGHDSLYYVLDIDLDFFSTANPFLDIYKEANCYMQLIDIFHFVSATVDNVASTTEKRKQQLDALKAIFQHLDKKRNFKGLKRPSKDVITAEVFEKIVKLEKSLKKCYTDKEIDWLLIFDSGCTTDTNGLPHHISTEDELNVYYMQFKEFLENLPHLPLIVTISCSSEDGYCPPRQVSSIRENVVRILQEVFEDKIHKKPIFHYLNDKWDLMKL